MYTSARGNLPSEPWRSHGATAFSESETVQGRSFLVAARLGYQPGRQPKTSTIKLAPADMPLREVQKIAAEKLSQ